MKDADRDLHEPRIQPALPIDPRVITLH